MLSSGSKITDTVRRIDTAKVEREGDKVLFTIAGNGFLYNMVRIMAGTLIEVGAGKIIPDEVSAIMRACSREKAGATAPSCGLYLNRVFY